jgi:chromosome segregation ATPase
VLEQHQRRRWTLTRCGRPANDRPHRPKPTETDPSVDQLPSFPPLPLLNQDGDDVDKLDKKGVGSAEDFENELQSSVSAFEALERDFQEVLQELMGDNSLEKFRLEYEKLHRALKKSHDQEKRLVKKCRELNSEIVNNQAKIKTALRLSQEDQQTITHLQKEMEKTWKLVSMSQEKETRAKETIQHLKDEMTNLSKLVERGAGISISQENVVKELKLAKEELQRQVDEQAEALSLLETQLLGQHKVQEDLRTEKDAALAESASLKEKLASKEAEIIRESKRRQKTHLELMDVRRNFDEKLKYEEKLLGDIAQQKVDIGDRDRHLIDAKATMDKYMRDYEALFSRTQKVRVGDVVVPEPLGHSVPVRPPTFVCPRIAPPVLLLFTTPPSSPPLLRGIVVICR